MKAIILAAGMGTRLRPLTNNTPKALVKVLGVPMIERQIEFLLDKGIMDIHIVTGYLHEEFNYLKEKYGVHLVHNDKYAEYNNIYTMYLVRDLLPDAYTLEGDVFMNNNVLDASPKASTYFSKLSEDFKGEWIVNANSEGLVTSVEVADGQNKHILSGISYWNEEDGKFIVEKLTEVIESGDFKDLYWDEIVKQNISDMKIYLKKLATTDTFEIDSVADLEQVEDILKQKI
ncbi:MULTISPECIES: sugar phosphate nucleotidyltransferase [unclassified Bacillus (in: firmicutes)]|uniref:sugar phosphate nucleotidyltransferase n=1 Tax=unclassified Bacillus (in: firmicutes) TaxID=185979 RepID=UPI0008E9C6FA|nr:MULTISPECIES: sugar phosphate nucleotidyltransferase [unclassified Bacillus (in: firmicutes)]SFB20946.1 CTP:phosphocholine cytidylyltransferase [Bacillus sp. UNCCL13]SFQ90934.1 CTP:phosphocholine cytidylyltransferase [Bacillus sp. cl95]